jgi:hypothetical protein
MFGGGIKQNPVRICHALVEQVIGNFVSMYYTFTTIFHHPIIFYPKDKPVITLSLIDDNVNY